MAEVRGFRTNVIMDEYKGKGTIIMRNRGAVLDYQNVEPIKVNLKFEYISPEKYIFEKCTDLISEIINKTDNSSCKLLLKFGNIPDYDFKFTTRILSPLILYNMILKDSIRGCCNIIKQKINRALAFCIVIHYIGSDDTTRESIDSYIFGRSESLNIPFYNKKVELVYRSFVHTYRFNTVLIRFADIFTK